MSCGPCAPHKTQAVCPQCVGDTVDTRVKWPEASRAAAPGVCRKHAAPSHVPSRSVMFSTTGHLNPQTPAMQLIQMTEHCFLSWSPLRNSASVTDVTSRGAGFLPTCQDSV